MTLKEIIREKENNLNKIPDELLTNIQKSEKEIYGKLITLLDKLRRDSEGRIIISKANIAVASEIENELKTIVLTKDYLDSLRKFASGFDEQAEWNDKFFAKVFDGFKTSTTADAFLESAKKTALNELLGAPMEASFTAPIADIINTSVSSGTSWVDLSNQIKDYVLGAGDESGKLTKYASQIAYDSFAYSDRSYTNIIAEENDAIWYLYSGTEQENSRCFCDERKGKFFHRKEIEAFGRGENLGACKVGTHWQGADKNTNEQTIFIYAGGHKCIDSILPVSIAIVPQDVIERNIANGNYTP